MLPQGWSSASMSASPAKQSAQSSISASLHPHMKLQKVGLNHSRGSLSVQRKVHCDSSRIHICFYCSSLLTKPSKLHPMITQSQQLPQNRHCCLSTRETSSSSKAAKFFARAHNHSHAHRNLTPLRSPNSLDVRAAALRGSPVPTYQI